MRFSNVLVPKTITVQCFHAFQECLFGSEVWGMADRGSDGRVISTPNIEQVKHYESMIRKDLAKRMNDGLSWWPAIQEATVLQAQFLSPVDRCSSRSVSAPGIAPFQVADWAANPKRALETSEQKPPGGGTASNKNTERKKWQRTKQQARYKALHVAVQNPRADAPRRRRRASSRLPMAARAVARVSKEERDRVASRQEPTVRISRTRALASVSTCRFVSARSAISHTSAGGALASTPALRARRSRLVPEAMS